MKTMVLSSVVQGSSGFGSLLAIVLGLAVLVLVIPMFGGIAEYSQNSNRAHLHLLTIFGVFVWICRSAYLNRGVFPKRIVNYYASLVDLRESGMVKSCRCGFEASKNYEPISGNDKIRQSPPFFSAIIYFKGVSFFARKIENKEERQGKL